VVGFVLVVGFALGLVVGFALGVVVGFVLGAVGFRVVGREGALLDGFEVGEIESTQRPEDDTGCLHCGKGLLTSQ